jgi:hypothetical protein
MPDTAIPVAHLARHRNDGKPDQCELEPAEEPLPEVSELPEVLALPDEPDGLVALDG